MKQYAITVNYHSTYTTIVTAQNKVEAIKIAKNDCSPLSNATMEEDGYGSGAKFFKWTTAIANKMKPTNEPKGE